MRKIVVVLVTLATTLVLRAQVPTNYADSLQSIVNSFQSSNLVPGISAAVLIKDVGIWQGVSGESHAGVALDTNMLLGIGSNTKLFTAVLCMKLVEQGTITLEDSLHQWLPSYNHVDPNITVRQLLQHQGGVDDYTNNPGFPNNVLNAPSTVWTPLDILSLIGPSNFQAGTSVQYSNTNYILAGLVLEAATGLSYQSLVRDSILTPLNLGHTFLEGFEPVVGTMAHPWMNGQDVFATPRIAIGTISGAAGCVVSKPVEMAIWYDAIFNQGFLSNQSLGEMGSFINWPGEPNNMGLGVFEYTYNTKTYVGHDGQTIGYSSLFLFDVDCKHSVAVIMNDGSAEPGPIAKALAAKICELTNIAAAIGEQASEHIVVYPNPSSDHISINGLGDDIISITLVDSKGSVMGHFENNSSSSLEIDTSTFPAGSYCFVFRSQNEVFTKQVMVLRPK